MYGRPGFCCLSPDLTRTWCTLPVKPPRPRRGRCLWCFRRHLLQPVGRALVCVCLDPSMLLRLLLRLPGTVAFNFEAAGIRLLACWVPANPRGVILSCMSWVLVVFCLWRGSFTQVCPEENIGRTNSPGRSWRCACKAQLAVLASCWSVHESETAFRRSLKLVTSKSKS